MLPTKFKVNWLFSSGEEAKIDFQDGRHGGQLRFSIGTILAMFDLQFTAMLPTDFQISWFSSRKAKYRFSRWPPRRTLTNHIRAQVSYKYPIHLSFYRLIDIF